MHQAEIETLPVYILAGGRSSRFGSDKALADVVGRPMLHRIAEQWLPLARQTFVIADRAGKYDSIGLASLADVRPALGPMGGLLTAISHAREGWLVLAACDAFVLDTDFPPRLLSADRGGVQAIAGRTDFWEPLPALYHTSILPAVQVCIAEGALSLWKLIEKVPHVAIEFPAGAQPVMHVNTQDDRRRLETLIGKLA